VKRRLAPREVDARDVRGFASFADDAAQELEREKLGVAVVEIIFGTKAVAAMKIADVGELHTQAMWTIVVTEVAFTFHEFMRDCTRS
jgi:hypothetical protein